MKKTVTLVVAFLFMALLFSSNASAGRYTVKVDDTLLGIAKKNGIELACISLVNPKIKNLNRILIGQVINLPENCAPSTVRRITAKKPVNIDGMIWRRVGADPYKGTAEWAIERFEIPSSVKEAALRNIANNNFQWVLVENWQKIEAVTFGKNKISKNVLTKWNDNTKKYAAKDYGDGDYVVAKVLWCGNWIWFKKVVPSPPPPEIPEIEKPKEPEDSPEGELPPIFKEVEVERSRGVYTHELDLGVGVWRNQDNTANGEWWFAQYKLFLEKYSTGLAGGTLTPVVGVFAKGDLGETDSGYEWNNWGVGPQVGAMWNGQTANGYPHQIQFMLRAIYFHMHGHNGWSGYSKEQEHILVGYYLEYIRRFHPKYMTILYAEGWFDVDSSFNSTWSGDKVNDLTQFVVGAKLHKDLTESWAARVGIQFGYQIEEDRFGANINAELRYDEWLIFGPSFDYCISSNVVNEAGGWAAGVFARVELKKQITEEYTEYRMQKVSASDKQLLEY